VGSSAPCCWSRSRTTCSLQPRDLAGLPTQEPVVLAWMPAASVYFRDPDNNLLEFMTMLTDPPRPDPGVLRGVIGSAELYRAVDIRF